MTSIPATQTDMRMPMLLLVGCCVVYGLGSMVGWLGPQITFGATDRFDIPTAQAGLLTMAEGLTYGLVALAYGAWPPKLTHRTIAVFGLALFVIANLLSVWAPNFGIMIALRCIAGIGDATFAFVAISLIAMRSPEPDKSFAIMTIVSVIFGSMVITAPPLLFPQFQGLYYLSFSAIVALLASPFLWLLPKRSIPGRIEARTEDAPPPASPDMLKFVIVMAFMVPMTFQTFGLYIFSPGLGARLGFSETSMNTLLGAANFVGIAGPFIGPMLVRYCGHWRAMALVSLLMLIINLVLTMTNSEAWFMVSLTGNLLLFFLAVPLLLGWTAEIDHSGRYSTIMMGSITMVTAVCATIMGVFVDHWGISSLIEVTAVSGALYVVILLLMPIAERKRKLILLSA